MNKLAEDKKEKRDVGLKILEDKMKDIKNIKATVNKIVADNERKEDGLKRLEDKVSDIKEILNQTIPTLDFAK